MSPRTVNTQVRLVSAFLSALTGLYLATIFGTFGPGRPSLLEVPLDRAVIAFEWLFDAGANYRTRITQRIVLSDDDATAFGSNLSDDMKRTADAMARAERGADE
jgi:hypothetical protein